MSITFYHKGAVLAMTNEDLAARIQQGDREMVSILWAQVEKFIAQQAGRRARALDGYGGVDADDLYQSGYLALLDAVEGYDPEAGMSFIGFLAFHLKTEFANATGHRSSRRNPLDCAASLDAPIEAEEGETSLGDILADPLDHYAEIETEQWREQLRQAIEMGLAILSSEHRDLIRHRYYQGEPLSHVARELGVYPETVKRWEQRALRRLRPTVERFIEGRTDYYMHVGLRHFNTTATSAVEEIVFQRERLRSRSVSPIAQAITSSPCGELEHGGEISATDGI